MEALRSKYTRFSGSDGGDFAASKSKRRDAFNAADPFFAMAAAADLKTILMTKLQECAAMNNTDVNSIVTSFVEPSVSAQLQTQLQ